MFMTRNLKIFSVAVVLFLALAGCGLLPGGDPLEGTAWTLVSYDGAQAIEGVTITAEFADGTVGGSSGCNSYGGSYEVNRQEITVSEVASTLMACLDPEGVMEQEQRFLELLMNAKTYTASADRLEITTADGGVLVFAPLAE